jgi:hypothetical protein
LENPLRNPLKYHSILDFGQEEAEEDWKGVNVLFYSSGILNSCAQTPALGVMHEDSRM